MKNKLVMIIPVGLLLALGAYGVSLSTPEDVAGATGAQPSPTVPPATTARPTADASAVSAEGKVVPISNVALDFLSSGRVAAIMVHAGSVVTKGMPLAQLDTSNVALGVAQAEAALHTAQANYADLAAGATPAEIAAAQGQVAQAQAQQRQAVGNVTPQDIAAANARVAQAAAALDALQAGPKADDVNMAQSKIAQSQADVQTQRDALSAAKTNAELKLNQATNDLVQAQAAYATAKSNWDFVQQSGADPANPKVVDANNKSHKNKLNDVQKQQYYQAFVQTEAAMHTAEQAVQQAQVEYDAARQQETSGIATIERQVQDDQTALHKLQQPAAADAFAAARAELADARAQLAKLQGDARSGGIAAAQANVHTTQANLDKLTTGARPTALAQAQAQIESAQVALQQAQLALQQATLVAPMDGVVAELNLKVGETPLPSTDAIVLADLNHWQIETTDLTELSIVQVKTGAHAQLTFDALPGVTLAGTVSEIRPIGKNKQGDITYTVVVMPDRYDARLRWNMTAMVTLPA